MLSFCYPPWAGKMSERLFEDNFTVTKADPDGKKFDKGTSFLLSTIVSGGFFTDHSVLPELKFSLNCVNVASNMGWTDVADFVSICSYSH
jgi:hypothetical protein